MMTSSLFWGGPWGEPPTHRFLESETALEIGMTAKTWNQCPSVLLGMTPGTLASLQVDSRLAKRVLELESHGHDGPPNDPILSAPDPFARAPAELAALG